MTAAAWTLVEIALACETSGRSSRESIRAALDDAARIVRAHVLDAATSAGDAPPRVALRELDEYYDVDERQATFRLLSSDPVPWQSLLEGIEAACIDHPYRLVDAQRLEP